MKITLGRFVFRTKGDAVKAVRNVLNSALPGLFLSGDELDLVTAVLDRHHDRDNKLAGGMIGIMVQWNNEAGYLSRCFHIVRPDWSTVDFSYRVALDQAPKGPTIEQACRMAVLPDIRAYRDARLAAGPQCCDASGEPLTPLNLNADHAGEWRFRRIIEEFVEWSTREGLSLRLAQSGIFTVEFADPQATEAFRAFHNARAVLRLVTQEINQSLEREETAKAAEEVLAEQTEPFRAGETMGSPGCQIEPYRDTRGPED
jgi:hypothetical protein